MKAIVQDRYGTPDVLEFSDIDEPVVGEDDVLVRVRAAGCGPDVWHFMTGLPYLARPMIGFRGPKVRVRGWISPAPSRRSAPTSRASKPVTTSWARAKRAPSPRSRSRPQDKLVPKPAKLTFEQAAAMPVSGCTAFQAVSDVAKVRAGQKVLVIGASGGVGSLAVQIAKALGAEVTGVCSTAKADLVRSIGADDVIDYTQEDFADGRRRWDVIVDTAGRRPLSKLRRALDSKGTLVIVGGDGGGRWTGGFFRGVLRAPLVSVFVGQRLHGLSVKEDQPTLLALSKLIEAGDVTPVIDRTFPLIEAPEAIRYLEQGHPAGKVVVTVTA